MIPGFGAGLVIPDLWQQEAVRALQQGKDVVVQAPTGSGKTYRDSQSRCPASRPSTSPSSRNVGPSQRYL